MSLTSEPVDTEPGETKQHQDSRSGDWQAVPLLVVLGVAILARNRIGWFADGELRLWATLFVSVCVQALPFLVLGVVVSGLIATFVSPELVHRVLPRRQVLAVPAAGVAGLALPGCECGSVPIAGRLVASGTPAAAALTFLLAAPAINPVVLVSTAVAFPNEPRLVLARFAASFLTAVTIGWWWSRRSGQSLLDQVRHDHDHGGTAGRPSSTWHRGIWCTPAVTSWSEPWPPPPCSWSFRAVC